MRRHVQVKDIWKCHIFPQTEMYALVSLSRFSWRTISSGVSGVDQSHSRDTPPSTQTVQVGSNTQICMFRDKWQGDALAIVPDHLLSVQPVFFICRIRDWRANADSTSTTVCVHCSWCWWVYSDCTTDADFHRCETLQEIPHEEGAAESV